MIKLNAWIYTQERVAVDRQQFWKVRMQWHRTKGGHSLNLKTTSNFRCQTSQCFRLKCCRSNSKTKWKLYFLKSQVSASQQLQPKSEWRQLKLQRGGRDLLQADLGTVSVRVLIRRTGNRSQLEWNRHWCGRSPNQAEQGHHQSGRS